MHTVEVQLWGGPQDGLRARVQTGEFTGPPSFIDVPEGMYGSATLLMPREEAQGALDGVSTVRYRVREQLHHEGPVIYQLERKESA
jgi:hypothetical protein